MSMDVTIFHNPACGNLSQHAGPDPLTPGIEPDVVEYLKTPPSHGEAPSS